MGQRPGEMVFGFFNFLGFKELEEVFKARFLRFWVFLSSIASICLYELMGF